jgi:hypothetical protein
MFSIPNDLREGAALSTIAFNIVLEHAVRKIQESHGRE